MSGMIAFEDNEDMMKKKLKAGSFNAMDLDKNLQSGLNRMQYKIPTPVQRKTIPVALAGMDLVCMARTGSGKTAAFLIPMLHKFPTHDSTAGIRGIVLSPTRELAVQTFRFAKDMAKFLDIRIISIIGGDPLEPQFEALSNRPDVLIATPGRLMHHLNEIETFTLKSCQCLVFDEADRLFEMGFADQLNSIIKQCPEDRQTMLFSATMPKQLIQFTRAGLRDPQLIRLETDNKMSDELRMAFFTVRTNEKIAAFLYLVRSVIPPTDMTIVFTATRHHSEYIHALLQKIGYTSTIVYGSMEQDLRASNLKDFRNNKISYLIVTDLAARGIDVPLLNNVINLHFPPTPKLFVHRCGRAARQGRIGYAFSLIEPEEMGYMADVHMFLGKPVNNIYIASGEDVIAEGTGITAGSSTSTDTAGTGSSTLISKQGQAGMEIGCGNSKGNAGGTTFVPVTTHGIGYTLEEFLPEYIHTGLLPQDVLDSENDFVRRLQADEESFMTMARIADNGMMQYRRTRSEASPKGVTEAKKLHKNNSIVAIHPLIAGIDPMNCSSQHVEKANFIRMLQTFRPAQTVLESGVGTGTGSSSIKGKGKKAQKYSQNGVAGGVADGVAIMKAFRKTTELTLERNKEKQKKLYDSFLEDQATKQSFTEKDEGVSHMGPVIGANSHSTTNEEDTRSSSSKKKRKAEVIASDSNDVWAQLEQISALEEKGAIYNTAEAVTGTDIDEYIKSSDAHEGKGGLKIRKVKTKDSKTTSASGSGSGSASANASSSNFRERVHSISTSEDDGIVRRLNAADRKRLKKQGKNINDTTAVAQLRLDRNRGINSSHTDDGEASGNSSSRRSSNNHDHGTVLTTDGYEPGSNNFADKRFYMAYGTEDQHAGFAEDSLQPHAGLKTAEAQHAAMMEAAMLDVAPDDMLAMNKAKRVLRWDAKKRKYVKQSMDEIASLKGNLKGRSEMGGKGSQGKSAKPAGEMYKAWAKRTHREVNTFKVMADIGTADIGNNEDVLRPIPKFKNNLNIASELKSENQIRKEAKVKSDAKMKNLPKDIRRQLEGEKRKKKNNVTKVEQDKYRLVHKATRKSLKAIPTSRKNKKC